MQIPDLVQLVQPVFKWDVLVVGSLLVLGEADDACVVSSSCSCHKMVDVIIEFLEHVVGFFMPYFELAETAEHEIFLA